MTIFAKNVLTPLSMVDALLTKTKRENMHLGLDWTTFDCKDDVILLSDWSPYCRGTSRDDYNVSYNWTFWKMEIIILKRL